MANAFYDSALESFALGDLDWVADAIKVALLRGYTPNLAAHQFLSDVTGSGAAIAATTADLTGKTAGDGILDATDTLFAAVPTGSECAHMVIYKDTGLDTTSNLYILIDTATNLPVTPNDGDISVQWDNGANKIGRI